MAKKINVRSPFYINKTSGTSGANVTLNLKIWTGAVGSVPGSATYSLTKPATIQIDVSTWKAVFEIAELIRDYIDTKFDSNYSSKCVWVNDGASTYLAVDGYGYYEEGTNPELSRTKLLSNKVIWRPYGENIRIPVYADDTYDVVMASGSTALRTESVTAQTNTTNMLKYISVSGTLSEDNYQQRVLSESGIYEYNPLLRALNNYVDVNLIDEIRIYPLDADGMTDEPYESIKVRTMHCDRYPDRKVTFVNKFGAFQDVYFFAKEVESINTVSEQYKANLMNFTNLTYSGHQYQSFNRQGRESVTLNTGFVSEDYNEVLKQMMLSEKVWLTKTDSESTFIYPITPRTNSLTYQTSLNDKMVSYTVEFDYAFDKIQNIR